jgi:HlyD family secretion protein
MLKSISCLLLSALLFSCSKPKEFVKASYKPIVISVYASGIIKSDAQYEAYSSDNGILENVFVTEGDVVSKGDILFQIDNRTSKLNSENAKLALELSRQNSSKYSSRITDAEMQLDQAKDKLRLDSSLYFRQKALWAQGVGTKVELEQKELVYETSRNAYTASKARLENAKLQVQTEYRQAQNNLKISKEREGNFFVKSQIDGYVYSILKERGEFVNIQSPIAIIGGATNFYVELQIDEYDIVNIEKGQDVYITMDSYKGKVFEAKVTKVYPIMNEKTRSFRVDAKFVKAPEKLFPNLTAEANIVISKKENALVLPRQYIFNDSLAKTIDGEQRILKLGLMNYQYAEILSGVDTTLKIVKP